MNPRSIPLWGAHPCKAGEILHVRSEIIAVRTPLARLCDGSAAGSSSAASHCCRLNVPAHARNGGGGMLCCPACGLTLDEVGKHGRRVETTQTTRLGGFSSCRSSPACLSYCVHVIGGQQQTCLASFHGSWSWRSGMRVSSCLLEAGVWRRAVGGRIHQVLFVGRTPGARSSTGGSPANLPLGPTPAGSGGSFCNVALGLPQPPHNQDPSGPL